MKGSCLCGSVSFETIEKVTEITACHCEMCNKWSSSPFIAVQLKESFSIIGEDNISYYQSSSWAERTFCKKCGTLLYYRSLTPVFYHFNAALFQPYIQSIPLTLEIFSDKKPNYYSFLMPNSKKMTEHDVLEYIKNTQGE
ncbi:GFA family protein [Salmonella enterica subsp. houtenae serovar [1],40:z4,z23:-]